jgi:hypothetical protein
MLLCATWSAFWIVTRAARAAIASTAADMHNRDATASVLDRLADELEGHTMTKSALPVG